MPMLRMEYLKMSPPFSSSISLNVELIHSMFKCAIQENNDICLFYKANKHKCVSGSLKTFFYHDQEIAIWSRTKCIFFNSSDILVHVLICIYTVCVWCVCTCRVRQVI